MNEAETRAEHIDPKLKASGWGEVAESRVLREFRITDGRIGIGGRQAKPEIADYVLVYKNQKLAVIEAKPLGAGKTEGLAQAKDYAGRLQLVYAYSTNGSEIYEVNMRTGKEYDVAAFPTPDVLWRLVNPHPTEWGERLALAPYGDTSGKKLRYYQENAIANVLSAIAEGKQRILLTLATGTGKTLIAAQIAWKLFETRWNLARDGTRRPRILFLADRNILADQAFYQDFAIFPEDGRVRIDPLEIRRHGSVPKNGSVFFTIFQTFMTGARNTPYYGEYPPDFFDFIIIDECHRGGANDEGNWRGILEYFSPAVQLGLTATPKRKDNIDTYRYFGEPVYVYSLKEGVNDGFLTPFKVKRISTTLDEYVYTSDDTVIEGEIEEGKVYEEADFNRIIEIKEREAKRVRLVLEEINQNEKTIIFCANQAHALAVRDLVNQYKKSENPYYCVRVTANDGSRGEQFLREFQDNDKTIPTILTTSQKLSTGVDAHNIRNIVLMRPINSMIEFKQIIGRGTRLFDGKEYFTILDFVGAYKHFADPDWDGEPIDETTEKKERTEEGEESDEPPVKPEEELQASSRRVKVKLRDGKEREIAHMISTMFWSANGKPVSAEDFLKNLYGRLPEFFGNEKELRELWSNPTTRKALLQKLADGGYGKEELEKLQAIIHAEDSDVFDVLAYVAFALKPISRAKRVAETKPAMTSGLSDKQHAFLEFVLEKYVAQGVDELDEEKLPRLLNLKYHAIADAVRELGDVDTIRSTFFALQRQLYVK